MKKGLIALIVALLAFGATHYISTRTKWFEGADLGILDILFHIRDTDGPRKLTDGFNPYVADETLLMGFDIESIAALGKWPWKRYVHGEFLDRIERFSPETVMFDVIFAQPESTPPFIMQHLGGDSNAQSKVVSAFDKMDASFAEALARYDNDYIDLQLMRQARDSDSEAYWKRLRANEEIILKYSQPVDYEVEDLFAFHAIEPIVERFASNAHLVAINTQPDPDGVVRTYPLFLTYRMADGAYRNVYSITLQILKRYYGVKDEDILLSDEKVVLKNARIPERDPVKSQRVLRLRPMDELLPKIVNPKAPESYAYNNDLKNFMINERRLSPATGDQKPYMPIHIVESKDGSIEVIDGWEALDAAREIGSKALDVIPHQIKDLEIKTPYPGFSYINYAAKQFKRYWSREEGRMKIHWPIPTRSYKDVFEGPELPALPMVDTAGDPVGTNDWALLDQWFLWMCEQRGFAAMGEAQVALGDQLEDDAQLFQFLNANNPDEGRFFFYYIFFQNAGLPPGQFDEAISQYPFFAGDIGQSEKYWLSRKVMIGELVDFYQVQFDRYYNRYVFSGGMADGMADVHQTPYRQMFGINVIISALNTILTENQYIWSRDIPGLDANVLIVFCLIVAFLYNLLQMRIGTLVFPLILIGTCIAAWVLFAYGNLYLKTTPLLLANVEIFLSITVYRLFTEERNKKFLQSTFGTYLTPELIDEMVDNKTPPVLGGEAREVTAYFTDIQGFSAFSEILTAEQLVELLNEYLSEMTEILISERGTLDKYIGDAIVAVFGAPMDLPDHGVRACRVAVKMQERQIALCEKWSREKQNPNEPDRNVKKWPAEEWVPGDKWPRLVHQMKTRIGINSGHIVVGNMGSSTRMNYTMMGDAVNLAARLEAGSKQFGIYSMVSEYTLAETFTDDKGVEHSVGDLVEARFIDSITVVGKSEPVKVYEICAMKGDLTDGERALFTVFNAAMKHYRDMKWDEAIEGFEQALKIERVPDGKITPSRMFIDRCHEFRKTPPVSQGETWDGVYRMTKK